MKRNQKLNHCQICTAMQNTKTGQEKCFKGLRGKEKVQTTTKYNVMHRLEQVPKVYCKNRLRVNGSKSKSAYQDKVLCKTAITLQHQNFVLLSKHIAIVKISCRFPKVEDAQGPGSVSLEKQIPSQQKINIPSYFWGSKIKIKNIYQT